MIAKDESLFVVMDALKQVHRLCRTEKLLSHSHDVTDKTAVSFGNTEGFGYISLTMMLLFLVIISHHIQVICVSMRIAQCQPHLC